MRRVRAATCIQVVLYCLVACADDAPPVPFSSAERAVIGSLAPPVLPPPPPDSTNRLADDPVAAQFGRKLFFDTRFSGMLLDGDNDGSPHTLGRKGETGRVACAGCHIPDAGFLDNRTLGGAISLAAGWGRRHTPSLLDVGQAKLLMWDGRRDTLHNQIFEAIESPVEMNSSRLFVAQQLARHYRAEYEAIFGPMPAFDDGTQFPQLTPEQTGCRPSGPSVKPECEGTTHGMPGDGGEFDSLSPEQQEAVTLAVVNMGKAIAAYQRRLDCGPGRFDAWANGDAEAMSESEQRGLKLFIGKAGCVNCHSGPYFSDQNFHNVGLIPRTVAVVFREGPDEGAASGLRTALADPLNSKGRFSDGDDARLPQSPGPEMLGAYKTPMLRCVNRRKAFMHTGQLPSLADVIEFFDQGGARQDLIGRNVLQPLGLSPSEKADLLQFLQTLEGPGPASEWLRP